jgi:hypothetical protein
VLLGISPRGGLRLVVRRLIRVPGLLAGWSILLIFWRHLCGGVRGNLRAFGIV